MAIPRGYFGQICSRSSLVKHHVITAEAGIIDSGFRGELFVFLFNHGKELFTIKPGDTIAQMVFMKKKKTVEFVQVNDLFKVGKTETGNCGFGSSGSKKIKFTESQPFDDNEEVIILEDATMSENGKIIVSEKSITAE